MPRAILLAAVAAFAAGNMWAAFARSGIPLRLSGTVRQVEVRAEKFGESDSVYLVSVGDRTVHLDRDAARLIHRGDRVDKRAWSRTVRISGRARPLHPSKDVRGMLVVMPLLFVAALVVSRR